MARAVPGRMTTHMEGDFVVFLIGMRINKPWKLHKWIPVARAMGPMLRALSKRRDAGLMSFTGWVGPGGPMLVQYWRSLEQLEEFARDPSYTHRAAWKAFNKNVGTGGDVGIWHETFLVKDGAYEALYGNMPRTGLAGAGSHVAVTSATAAAAGRRLVNATAREPQMSG